MSTDLNMKVNVLPVLTYGFLHVNEGTLSESDIVINSFESPKASRLPDGVSCISGVSYDAAGQLFREKSDRILASNGTFDAPNGDTFYMNDSQALPTGMGKEVDELMESMNVSVDVYTVEEGKKVETPIVLHYDLKDGDGNLSAQVIHAKKGSDVTIIMDYNSEKEAAGFLGVSTRVLAEEGARVTLVRSQLLGNGFIHFDDIGGACFEKGGINVVSLELGAKNSFVGLRVTLSEKESELLSSMGYLCRDDHKLDINYVADQRGKKTNALMDFKGVLMDNASKTFRGTIDFKSGSSGSVGNEQEDALLLSEDVINRTMPVILCQEEDVDGRHGATIGQLSEELLFYMQTRGIDEDEAKRIMIKARLESVSRMIPDPELMQRTQYFIQSIV